MLSYIYIFLEIYTDERLSSFGHRIVKRTTRSRCRNIFPNAACVSADFPLGVAAIRGKTAQFSRCVAPSRTSEEKRLKAEKAGAKNRRASIGMYFPVHAISRE